MTSSAGMSASSYTTAYSSEPATAAHRRSSTSPEALRPEMPKRRSSSSRRTNVSYVDDGEEELPHTPLAPPTYASAEDELDEHLAARVSGESALGGWHYAPLLVGIGPPLGAILGGKVDHWSDAILLLLSSFWVSRSASSQYREVDPALIPPTSHSSTNASKFPTTSTTQLVLVASSKQTRSPKRKVIRENRQRDFDANKQPSSSSNVLKSLPWQLV